MGKWSSCYRVHPDPFDPDSKTVAVRVCLFRDVANPGELKALLEDGALPAAFVRADLVLEVFQLLTAASRALNAESKGRMVTRSLQTELIYSLSPTKNISESLATFGMGPETPNVVAVTFDDEKGAVMARVAKRVQGRPADLAQLINISDYALVKKVYHVKDPELNAGSIIDAIASRIATKDYVS